MTPVVQAHSALEPAGAAAALIVERLWDPMYITAAVVFVLVIGALALGGAPAARRGGGPRMTRATRAASGGRSALATALHGGRAARLPRPRHLGLAARPPPLPGKDALQIAVTGHQWWWEVQYRDSVAQHWVTTANEIHVPRRPPVAVELRSTDVIHSFWPPSLAGKRDQIPGRENSLWLQADRAGRLSRPVRRVLRAPAREDGVSGRRRAAGQLRALAGAAARYRAPRRPTPRARAGRRCSSSSPLRRCATPSPARRPGAASVPTSRTSRAAAPSPPARCPTRAATWPAGSSIRSDQARRQDASQQLEPAGSAARCWPTWRPSSERAIPAASAEPAGAGRRGELVRRSWSRPGARRPASGAGSRSVDHKSIGKRYIVTAFVFFLLGGHRGGGDAGPACAAGEHAPRARRLQPVLHHARHDDDVPLRRAGDGRRSGCTWCRS